MLPFVHGATFLSGENALTNLTSNLQLIDGTMVYWDNVYAISQSLILSQQLEGDLFGLGRIIVINSPVEGDVFAIGQTVTISAPVTGDLRVIATNVIVDAPVKGEVLILSDHLKVTSKGLIKRELVGNIDNLEVYGRIEEGMRVTGNTVEIDAPIGSDTDISAEKINLGKNALIGGDFVYRSPTELTNLDIVSGNVTWLPPKKSDMVTKVWETIEELISTYLAFLIIALILVFLLGSADVKQESLSRYTVLLSFGIGLLALCATPVIVILLLFTGLGIPLSLLLAAVYLSIWYLAKYPISLYIGSRILPGKSKYLHIAVGWLILLIATRLPIVGWVFYVIGILMGTGIIVKWLCGFKMQPNTHMKRKKKN
jgi:cytoskeletal protein CcmA (bactofilin family)